MSVLIESTDRSIVRDSYKAWALVMKIWGTDA
jgi:hypothetical protein